MTALHLLLIFAFFGASVSIPEYDLQSYALNPAEINNHYINPASLNPLRDVPPQPLVKPNVEDTVKEVEALILANPKLPRLTRGEIIDIIENITRTDKKTREDGKRALMVVMPFTAGSAQGDDIRELYTRTPVTRIIGDVDSKDKVQKKRKKPPRKWPLFPEINIENEVLTEDKNTIPKFQFLPNVKPSSTTSTTTTTTERITKRIPSTTRTIINNPITTYKPKYTGTWSPPKVMETTEQTPILSPVYSSPQTISPKPKPTRKFKPQKFSNHHYPEEANNEGMQVVSPPVLVPMSDDGYSVPYTISLKKPHLQPHATIEEVKITPDMYGDMPKFKKPKPQNWVPTTTTTTTTTTENTVFDDIAIPEQYKGLIKGLDLIISPENKTPQIKQVIKQVNPQKVYKHATTTAATTMPDISNVADNLSPDMKELLMNFGLINKPTPRQPEIITEAIPFYAQNAEINPNSYASFKPLPNNAPTRNDMDEFLSRFGLGRNSFRSQKSISMDKPKKVAAKTSELNLEAVPDNLKNVVFDLGFTTKNIRDVPNEYQHIFNPSAQNSTDAELKKLGKLLDMIKDLEKMHGNITKENLKDFDTNTLKELIGNFNGNSFVPLNEQDAPNPINLAYNIAKNGVKREETTLPPSTEEITTIVYGSADDSKDATSEDSKDVTLEDLEASFGGLPAAPITTEAASTTINTVADESSEDSKSASLEDLEASFGAMVETPVTTEAPTTTTTVRTGFYYLLDWNSFWEMDNQNGRRLNLRFQPHAGNPRYFQSVTVP